ncbi:hypothetical protein CCICO_03365 [Corynebacterium ciconiae DSM 44920]|uniref:hypothetical protein n=1 Tax=Corynebacterium ciconiae TaxID=227319 RepID=UPI0003780FA0|nr:hypothetical protein CCICO_03365 [Corynebacterium ciconiae DSM 44920]
MSEKTWYYNVATGEVSDEKIGSWDNRMGPYATEGEARNAFEIAHQRNEDADERDRDDDWDNDDWG